MIVVGFSRPKAWWKLGSAIIRLVDGTPYSHVYISWQSEGMQRELVYQASGHGGVNFCSSKRFLADNVTLQAFMINEFPDEKRIVMQRCIDSAGDDYGYLQLIGIGLVRILNVLKFRTRNPFPHGQVCSECVSRILHDAFKLNFAVPFDLISPHDVSKALENNSRFMRIL